MGAWRSPASVAITDPVALRASGMSIVDRARLRLLSLWPRWLGRVWLHTSVACEPGGLVLHTTVVRWLGLPLEKSAEQISIRPDGRSFDVSGGMIGAGKVDDSATRAEYEIRWLGVPIRMRTVREGEQLTVRQTGPGFEAVQRLVRQS